MIFTYNWLKDVFKIYITVSITSVNTDMLVVKLYSTCYNLREMKHGVKMMFFPSSTLKLRFKFVIFSFKLLELLHGTFQ